MAKSFECLEDLAVWLNENGVHISDLEFEVANDSITINETPEEDLEIIEVTEPEEKVVELDETIFTVKSLTNQPSIALYENREYNENIWFVDDYEFIEGACGTSKVTFDGSTLLMNVCESEGRVQADLLCETGGELKRVKFNLEKRCNHEVEYDMILSA